MQHHSAHHTRLAVADLPIGQHWSAMGRRAGAGAGEECTYRR